MYHVQSTITLIQNCPTQKQINQANCCIIVEIYVWTSHLDFFICNPISSLQFDVVHTRNFCLLPWQRALTDTLAPRKSPFPPPSIGATKIIPAPPWQNVPWCQPALALIFLCGVYLQFRTSGTGASKRPWRPPQLTSFGYTFLFLLSGEFFFYIPELFPMEFLEKISFVLTYVNVS